MVKIHTEHGVLAYIAADEGPSVEARHAAKESGKTEEQKEASVLNFCAAEQLWPDFVIVEITIRRDQCHLALIVSIQCRDNIRGDVRFRQNGQPPPFGECLRAMPLPRCGTSSKKASRHRSARGSS